MQIEVTQNMLDWYHKEYQAAYCVHPTLQELQYAISEAINKENPKKEKPKLPEKISMSTSNYANTQYAVTTINQLIDYLKAKENNT